MSAQFQHRILLTFAIFASLGMTCCVAFSWSVVGSSAEQLKVEQLSDVAQGTRVEFQASIDAAAVAQLEGRLGGMLDSYLAGVAEDRKVALFCDDNCQNIEIFRSAFVLEGNNPILPNATFVGEVKHLDEQGLGFADLPPQLAHEFARKLMGLDVSDMTVVRIRSDRDRLGEFAVVAATVVSAIAALVLWLLFVLHPKLVSRPLEAPTEADFKMRSPYLIMLFSLLTVGIYALYLRLRFTGALRRMSQEAHLVPWMDVVLSVLTLGLWGVYADARNGKILDKLPIDSHGYFAVAMTFGILGIFCNSLGIWWVGLATNQYGLNQLIERKRR